METLQKLEILADAAKYDASCASSGTQKRDSFGKKGLGSTTGSGICHSYTPDGRCVSLLKILLTNFCIFDCAYCVNRRSSNVKRARFTVDEVVNLTLNFYKRNYIEGLFLSSGIIQNSDYTMEQLVTVAKKLRLEHNFRGYIHLKTIPDADELLLAEAGRYADRLSINVELPTQISLEQFAPEKNMPRIHDMMSGLKERIAESKAEKKAPKFSPGGQSTQMIVGADQTNDQNILATSSNLYNSFKLKRVYYSAFSPIPDASKILPLKQPPLIREHRLYQADWLLRFYGFTAPEITTGADGMLDLEIDPKLAWALANRALFPLDINSASKEELLRVPGLGARTVQKILMGRRYTRLRLDDIMRLHVPRKKIMPFITASDYKPALGLLDSLKLKSQLILPSQQLSLFDYANNLARA